MVQVADRIYSRRVLARMSQADLAELSGCSRNQIGRIERGVHLPRTDTLVRIAAALGLSVGELLEVDPS